MHIIIIIADRFLVGWLESVGSRVVYELDYKKPILYVVPIQSILGNLPLVPVGDTGTVPHSMRDTFSGAPRLPATGGRAQAMDAGYNSSTRGKLRWSRDGVTCIKSHGIATRDASGRKVPCEHDTSPFLGRATVCSGCALPILIASLGSASAR
jgi:hypothetical protein